MKKLNEMRRTRTEPYTLIGCDGNAFAVIGYVQRAMRECGKTREEINGYAELAKQGDYNNLLCISMEELEQLNDELGFDENAQIDDIYESKKTSKKSKKLNEEDEYYDNIHYEIKKVLNNAISDALIKIWDDCGFEFTKEEANKMLHAAVDNFLWEHFSLYNYMPMIESKKTSKKSKKLNESLTYSDKAELAALIKKFGKIGDKFYEVAVDEKTEELVPSLNNIVRIYNDYAQDIIDNIINPWMSVQEKTERIANIAEDNEYRNGTESTMVISFLDSFYNWCTDNNLIEKSIDESEDIEVDIPDIKFGEIYDMKSPNYLTRNSHCLYLDYEYLTNNNLDINEIANYICNTYEMDVYIINKKDIQVIFSATDSLAWTKILRGLQKDYNLKGRDLLQKFYDKEQFLKH